MFPVLSVDFTSQYEASFQTNRWRLCLWGRPVCHFLPAEEVVCQSPSLPARPLSKVSARPPPTHATSLPRRHPPCPGSLDENFSPGDTSPLFSAMATSAKRKQEETHLKMLREMTSLPANRKCFDCDQRGPTYVNMTVGSFVCTTCSGILWVYFWAKVSCLCVTVTAGRAQGTAVSHAPTRSRSGTDLAAPLAR